MTTYDPRTSPTTPPREAAGDGEAGLHGSEEQLAFGVNPRHFGIEPGEPWPDDVPKDQDDTHWRFEDDPKGARRAERRIAACWTLTVLGSIGLASSMSREATPSTPDCAGVRPSSVSASA